MVNFTFHLPVPLSRPITFAIPERFGPGREPVVDGEKTRSLRSTTGGKREDETGIGGNIVKTVSTGESTARRRRPHVNGPAFFLSFAQLLTVYRRPSPSLPPVPSPSPSL
ncbi:hypothetical protein AKJ39_03915 [candidate division MSBL1 archaeon SCGC-AAA259J03]|uniref:Uncharacterized protein n=1 Tax=candidate division MSBL1 archaeon SCGC-AAA259J03 TaxID=1698269 RepID=A0A656YVE6_9EURY|nr:hypothetical protein AKJ39_03915 [candidate division MSBL1 archaeon SCGC-AAA259J03]